MSDPRLSALRLADSALPVGTDSVSYGLEQFVADERVTDADDLCALLETYLRRQLGRGDLVALRVAHQAATEADIGTVVTADQRLTAATTPAEFRASSERTGGRLLALQTDLNDDAVVTEYANQVDAGAPGNYAVALGVVGARESIPRDEICLVSCHEFMTGLLGAAQRLMGISHTDIQRVLDELQPTIREAVDDSNGRTLAELEAFTPMIDIWSAAHERADRRLFLS